MKTKLTACGSCGREIAKSASRCPQCGAARSNAARLVALLVGGAVLALVAWVMWIGPMLEKGSDIDVIEQQLRGTLK